MVCWRQGRSPGPLPGPVQRTRSSIRIRGAGQPPGRLMASVVERPIGVDSHGMGDISAHVADRKGLKVVDAHPHQRRNLVPLPLMVGLLVFLAVFFGSYAVKPLRLGRSIRSAQLLCVAALCLIGFLASFEVSGIAWKAVYASTGAMAVGGAIAPWLIGRS